MNQASASDLLPDILSVFIDNDFDIETTVKNVSLPHLRQTVERLNPAGSDHGDSILSDLKNGLSSIVYTGLTSGLDRAEAQSHIDMSDIFSASKQAAWDKSKELLSTDLCDGVQSRVNTSLNNRRAAIEKKKYKTETRKNAALFTQDSAQTFADNGIENLRGVFRGDLSTSEAFYATMTDSAVQIKDKVVDGALNKVCEKVNVSKYISTSDLTQVAKNAKDSFVSYLNGDLPATEFFLQLGERGLFRTAQTLGNSIGTSIVTSAGMHGIAATLTAAASSTIITAIYSELYKYAMNTFAEERASAQRLQEIKKLSEEAIQIIRKEREFLENTIVAQTEQQRQVFRSSLSAFGLAIQAEDIDLLVGSLNTITTQVGGTVQYHNFEEFQNLMLDDSQDFEL